MRGLALPLVALASLLHWAGDPPVPVRGGRLLAEAPVWPMQVHAEPTARTGAAPRADPACPVGRHPEVVVAVGEPAAPAELRFYEVRDLVRAIVDYPGSSGPTLVPSSYGPPPDEEPVEDDRMEIDELAEMLQREIPAAEIQCRRGILVVTATWQRHGRIAEHLAALRLNEVTLQAGNGGLRIRDSASHACRSRTAPDEVVERLRTRHIDLPFDHTPFLDVTDYLTYASGIDVVADRRLPAEVTSSRITLHASRVTAEAALRLVTLEASPRGDVLWTIEGKGVRIVTSDQGVVRVHAVEGDEARTAEIVRARVASGRWGDPGYAVEPGDGVLIVTAPRPVHDEVAAVLSGLPCPRTP